MAGGKEKPVSKGKPSLKEKQLAARRSISKDNLDKNKVAGKEKRTLKLGNVSKLYAQNAEGTRVVIGRKRDRQATAETPARCGRQVSAFNA